MLLVLHLCHQCLGHTHTSNVCWPMQFFLIYKAHVRIVALLVHASAWHMLTNISSGPREEGTCAVVQCWALRAVVQCWALHATVQCWALCAAVQCWAPCAAVQCWAPRVAVQCWVLCAVVQCWALCCDSVLGTLLWFSAGHRVL